MNLITWSNRITILHPFFKAAHFKTFAWNIFSLEKIFVAKLLPCRFTYLTKKLCKKYQVQKSHYVKCMQIRSFFWSVFSRILTDPKRYEVSLRIQSECGKIRTRKNSVFGHFSRSVYFWSCLRAGWKWPLKFSNLLIPDNQRVLLIHLETVEHVISLWGEIKLKSSCVFLPVQQLFDLNRYSLMHLTTHSLESISNAWKLRSRGGLSFFLNFM